MSSPERIARAHQAIQASPYWKNGRSDRDSNAVYFRSLRCPDCGQAEAWVRKDKPWVIFCPRENHCGARIKTRDVVQIDPFNEFEYQPTRDNPHKAAEAYLREERGLDKSMAGLKFRYEKDVRGLGCGAVMFHVGTNADGVDVWNGRIFNPPPGESKSHNTPGGKITGMVWRHPGIQYDPNEPVYVTEGIINALALIEMGFHAVAVLASNQFPQNVDLSPWPKRVYAFDNDPAGQKATKKWREHDPDADAILPPSGADWNDILLSSTPADAKKYIEDHYSLLQFYANISLADTADDYLITYHAYHDRAPGLFIFKGRYYWGTVKELKDGPEYKVARMSNFVVDTRYFELTDHNPDEPENRYALKINPEKGRPVNCIVTASDLAAPNQMTKMFLQRGRVLWEGDRGPTMALIRRIVESKAPVVRQALSLGFDPASNWYVHQGFAIDDTGKMRRPNKSGFFAVTPRDLIKPTRETDTSVLVPKRGKHTPADIYRLIHEAWPNKGPAALAWTMGAWWVNQIKAKTGFFPHMSLYKDSQTGKSNLSIICHRCQCMDTEGVPLNKSTTMKGIIRKIGRRSGAIVGLLESNNERAAINYADLVLTTYNVNPLQTRAKTTNDMQTHDIEMRAALLFVQNQEPFKSKPEKERVVSLRFDEKEINDGTKKAFFDLKAIPAPEFAWVYATVMAKRQMIESNWFDEFEQAKKDLSCINDARIIENHAVVLAFHRLLMDCVGIDRKEMEKEFLAYVTKTGEAKRSECTQNMGAIADTFFDIILQLNEEDEKIAAVMQEKGDRLQVNLPGLLKEMHTRGYPPMYMKDLQEELRAHPAFVPEESNKAYRFWEGVESRPKKAWVFNTNKLSVEDGEDV